jgi:hypothetical protein
MCVGYCIFSHRIVHWVYNYMFRPSTLATVRLYCKLNNQLYNMCVGYYIFSHRIVHTTTCFGPLYWPSSGCTVNLTSNYTIFAWGTLGGTRSCLTLVEGMVLDHCGPVLTLILLMWRIWWVPNNVSRWQMNFNSAFKGLIVLSHNPTGIRPHKTGHHILIDV